MEGKTVKSIRLIKSTRTRIVHEHVRVNLHAHVDVNTRTRTITKKTTVTVSDLHLSPYLYLLPYLYVYHVPATTEKKHVHVIRRHHQKYMHMYGLCGTSAMLCADQNKMLINRTNHATRPSAVSMTDPDIKHFEGLTSKAIGEEVKTLKRQRDSSSKKKLECPLSQLKT